MLFVSYMTFIFVFFSFTVARFNFVNFLIEKAYDKVVSRQLTLRFALAIGRAAARAPNM